jgi:effector-binding domain-containing protein
LGNRTPDLRITRTASLARVVDVPAGEFAVAVHEGSFAEIDRTYAALGGHVVQRALGIEGPIREYYLVTAAETPDESQHRTDVCWPIFRILTT